MRLDPCASSLGSPKVEMGLPLWPTGCASLGHGRRPFLSEPLVAWVPKVPLEALGFAGAREAVVSYMLPSLMTQNPRYRR